MEKQLFGKMPDGREVYSCTMSNKRISATILSLGGIVQKLIVDDVDVVFGFDTVEDILTDTSNQGALIGRYGNRIAKARFAINGKEYKLFANNHGNHLHGGKSGFNRKLWEMTPVEDNKLVMKYLSVDGEEGYPGNLDVTVTYTLLPEGLHIHYEATTDADTYVNLTNHAYFNLDGIAAGSDILSHYLKINSDNYTAVDDVLIPTGERPDVTGTPFDFRVAKKIGRDLDDKLTGYDHNFILNGAESETLYGKTLTVAAVLYCAKNIMTVYTDQPCVQVYTANFLGEGGPDFKGGIKQFKRMAVCLETQCEPDSPSHGEALLRAGEKYDTTTIYKFR